MKTLFLVCSMTLFIGHFATAQNHNTLWCDKNMNLKNTHHLQQQKTTEKGKLNFLVKWGAPKGGSTLTSANVKITNGTCEKCPSLGAIGSGNYQQNWVIKVTDPSKPVRLEWNTPGTVDLCGKGVLHIPPPAGGF